MPVTYTPPYFYITPEISVICAIMFSILILVLTMYLYVQVNLQYIKNQWEKEKCRAGIVIGDYNNLVECSQHIVKSVVDKSTTPLYEGTKAIGGLYKGILSTGEVFKSVIAYINLQITNIFVGIRQMVYKIFLPIQIILNAVTAVFSKVKAVIISQIYFMSSTLITMKSFLEAMINAIIVVLIALAALIIAMMIMPFGWGIAASFLAIFVSISIPLAAFVAVMSNVVHLNIHKIPKRPHVCFDKHTKLVLLDGSIVSISNIPIGTVLKDGSVVTSTLVLDIQHAKMFYLNNVLVTGSHIVQYNNTWISVKDHPRSIHVPDYKERMVYCINTSTGIINIGETTFTDWNEMLVDDFILHPAHFVINLVNGNVPISKCIIGDVLSDNRIITGLAMSIQPGSTYVEYHIYAE
jgi:hypothetical protein